MIKRLLEAIECLDFKNYSEMLFNLYEDKEEYSVEIVFDENALIIGRDDQRFAIEKRNVDFDAILKDTALVLKLYFKENKDKYKQCKSQYKNVGIVQYKHVGKTTSLYWTF